MSDGGAPSIALSCNVDYCLLSGQSRPERRHHDQGISKPRLGAASQCGSSLARPHGSAQRKDGEPTDYAYFGVGNVFIVDDERAGNTLTTERTFYGLGGKYWTDLELADDGWRI